MVFVPGQAHQEMRPLLWRGVQRRLEKIADLFPALSLSGLSSISARKAGLAWSLRRSTVRWSEFRTSACSSTVKPHEVAQFKI